MVLVMTVLAATTRPAAGSVWYGPATATFQVQFAGNPFDPAENDVQVQFKDKQGNVETRLAYFNEPIGSWQAVLIAHHAGSYQAHLIRNGTPSPVKAKEGTIKLMAALPHGFIHPDPKHANRFAWDDGTPCAPMGIDIGWQNPAILPITDQITKIGKAGMNWTRVWACSWDGKNPWWPSDKTKLAPRTLWAPALTKWDGIEEACSASNVGLQFTLFHHGEFSSQVDPNWPDNPWNVKNGGFLNKPGDFFTDAEAKTRAKIWLRYAVARYAASPGLFGWELFNEVQWVDPIHIDHRWDEVEAWHKEMADYIRSIDPYHHPVTSSSELRPNLNASLDYLQPHTYPNNVFASVVGAELPTDKPVFFGEFGPGNTQNADMRQAILDGMLGGLLANQAGSGMFWYWDTVEQKNLYQPFSIGRKVMELSKWALHPDAKIQPVGVYTAAKSTFVFEPGMGWGPTTQFSFDLPNGANAASLGKVSSYLQGSNNRKLLPQPIQLKFTLDQPSTMRIAVGEISGQGGNVVVSIDGTEAKRSEFKHGDSATPIELPLSAGSHIVTLNNDGIDWVTLKSVSIDHLAPMATATALVDSGWMMMRLTRNGSGSEPVQVIIDGLLLRTGKYNLTEVSLKTGLSKTGIAAVKDSKISLTADEPDEIVILSPAS